MPAKRYGIIAGNGMLPALLAQRLMETGYPPFVIGIEGEADPTLFNPQFQSLPLEEIAYSVPLFKKDKITHVVFAGGVKRRPNAKQLRVPMVLWSEVPGVLLALKRGDDGLLAAMIKFCERQGLCIIGAHDILPDHIAPFGVIAGTKPSRKFHGAIKAGVQAAGLIGDLDIGQAVVALGKRIIAVEGLEGTDQMLSRVRLLRLEGRIDKKSQPVLIKLAKPNQELRADMPVIGVTTIEACKAAGISLICVSAGTTLMTDVAATVAAAKLAKIDIFGIDAQDWLEERT